MAIALPTQCPVCRKRSVEAVRPFCSQRCATIDLGRWLGEAYRAPSEEEPELIELPERRETEA